MATTQLAAYNTITLTAGEDLSAKQHRYVKINSSGLAVLCGAGEQGVGVLKNKPASGEAAEIQVGGVGKVQADAAITAGDRIMSSADGQATPKTGVNNSMGIALEAATTAGDVISYKIDASDGVAGGGVGSFENTAITPTVGLALLTVDGTDTLTLANGSIAGQEIEIVCVVASNTPVGTLTPATVHALDPATWVFKAVGQAVKFKWTGTAWKVIKVTQAGSETLTTGQTANPLCIVHKVAIADTVDFLQPAAVFPGQRSIWLATANSGTPVGTVSGLFYLANGAATGIDVNFNAAGDSCVLEWLDTRWYVANLVSATVS